MKKLMICSTAFISISAFAHPGDTKCDASMNPTKKANIEKIKEDGSVVFYNPSCKVDGEYLPIIVALTGLPPRVVSSEYYCNLKGYTTALGTTETFDYIKMVSLAKDGSVEWAAMANSVYFTAIRCTQ